MFRCEKLDHIRRNVKSALSESFKALSTVSQKSATVAEFGDSRTFLRQSLFSINCRRNRRLCRQVLILQTH